MAELIVVKAEQCLPLREKVLRPGQPPSAYRYAQDEDERAMHFAAKQGKKVLGVASLLPERRDESELGGGNATPEHDPAIPFGVVSAATERPAPGRPGSEAWRLRGMAVAPDHQKKGLGRMLLLAVQAVAEARGGGLWCTARTHVEPFYAAFGFRREGGVFDLPGGGPHVIMTWTPPPRRRAAPPED